MDRRDLRRQDYLENRSQCSIIVAGVVGAAASIGGAAISSHAASSAANTQAAAADRAAQIQHDQYLQTRADLQPYNATGQQANAAISGMGNFGFAPTQENLATTPGYQFTQTQGLKAAQNSAAARGLGVSGAAFKGATSFATGLANTTYQDRFNNAMNTYNTNLNRLQGQATLGENAAGMTGNYGTQTAQAIGQAAVGAANARAAGTVGSANAISNGITAGIGGLSNAFLTNQFLNGQGSANAAGIYASSPGAIANPGSAIFNYDPVTQ